MILCASGLPILHHLFNEALKVLLVPRRWALTPRSTSFQRQFTALKQGLTAGRQKDKPTALVHGSCSRLTRPRASTCGSAFLPTSLWYTATDQGNLLNARIFSN